jgi:predicted  nucleic acid-binding Zn-ribbon protein
MADVAVKVEHLEEDVKEHRIELDETHERLDVQSDAIDRVTRWALEGNGKSAESRLVLVEQKVEILPEIQTTLAAVKLVADAKLEGIEGAVANALNKNSKTIIAYIKAGAELLVGIGGLAALIALFVGR